MNVSPKTILNTQKIAFDHPCPEFGSPVEGIGGKYEGQDGQLVRVGDYDGTFLDGGNLGE